MKSYALRFVHSNRFVWIEEGFWYGQLNEARSLKDAEFNDTQLKSFLMNKYFLKPILEGKVEIVEIGVQVIRTYKLKEVEVPVEKVYTIEERTPGFTSGDSFKVL